MCSPEYPEPPSAEETSSAETSSNIANAIANTTMGNVDQYSPQGSITYDTTGYVDWTDPFTGETYQIPEYAATTTLSPEEQAIYESGVEARGNLSSLAADQSAFLSDYMSEPFSYDTGDHEEWAMDLYNQIYGDNVSSDRDALNTQLANQGIGYGSEAYDDAMGSLYSAQDEAALKFLLDSYATGFSSAQATRNQPINEITALLSGSQVSQPSIAPTNTDSIESTDVSGNIWDSYSAEMDQAQAEADYWSNVFGGLFGKLGI